MLRTGWNYAKAARGPVPARRGMTADLTPIPAYGEAFPPLGPQPPTPAPVATASEIEPEAVHVISLCQRHISISIFSC